MKLYSTDDFKGLWPVPVAAVVLAADEAEARKLMDAALIEGRLSQDGERPYTLREIPMDAPIAVIISNGDY